MSSLSIPPPCPEGQEHKSIKNHIVRSSQAAVTFWREGRSHRRFHQQRVRKEEQNTNRDNKLQRARLSSETRRLDEGFIEKSCRSKTEDIIFFLFFRSICFLMRKRRRKRRKREPARQHWCMHCQELNLDTWHFSAPPPRLQEVIICGTHLKVFELGLRDERRLGGRDHLTGSDMRLMMQWCWFSTFLLLKQFIWGPDGGTSG